MQHFTDTYVSVQGGILYGTCSGALGNTKDNMIIKHEFYFYNLLLIKVKSSLNLEASEFCTALLKNLR